MDEMERTATELRECADVAHARAQAARELEQSLVAQEQLLEEGTGVPIVEQADGDATPFDPDAESDVIFAGEGAGSSGLDPDEEA